MFPLFLSAAGQVALVAVILGAGLPALFAVGVRSFATASGALVSEGGARPSTSSQTLFRVLGVLCIAVMLAAVAVGLTIIVANGFGKAVSFQHIIPMLVDKS